MRYMRRTRPLNALLTCAVVGLASLAAAQEPFAFTPNHTHPAYKTMQAVCQLRIGKASGSGTLVGVRDDLALILTCRHVAQRVGAEAVVSWPLADNQQMTGVVTEIVPRQPDKETDKLGRFSTDLAIVICRRPKGVDPVRVTSFMPGEGPYIAMGWRAGLFRLAISPTADERPDAPR